MELVLQPHHSILLYRSSFLAIPPVLYCYYRGHYTLVFAPVTIFLTSVNYWRHPTNSWRRLIDVMCSLILCVYQGQLAWTSEYATIYYLLVLSGLSCYPIGYHYYNKGMQLESVYLHVLLHVFMCISSLILYHGEIPAISSRR